MPSPFNLRARITDAFSVSSPAPSAAAPSPIPTPAPSPAAGLSSPAGPGTIHHDTNEGAETGARMFNELGGMGGLYDKGATARPNIARLFLTESELIAEMRGGPYRRICAILPRWATWRGVTLTDESDDEAPLSDALKRLSVLAKFAAADTWARGLGEAMVWLVTDDPAPLDQPLDPTSVRGVKNLIVLDAREFSAVTMEDDPEDPQFGQPRTYHVHPRRWGASGHTEEVHHTRLLRFVGHELPHGTVGALGTLECDAIGQVLWDALRNLAQTSAAGAAAAQELSVSVFKVDGLSWKVAGGNRQKLIAAVKTMNRMKGIINGILIGRNDSYERVAFNPSGYKDLLEGARLQLALVTSIPLSLLFGEAPSGLSTDEKSWWANWTATVSQHQQLRYQRHLEFLLRCLYASRGGEPETWAVSWNPLGELSERDEAELRKLHTEADSIALADGVLSAAQVRRSRYSAEGFTFTIQPATPEEEAELLEEASSTPEPQPPAVLPMGAAGVLEHTTGEAGVGEGESLRTNSPGATAGGGEAEGGAGEGESVRTNLPGAMSEDRADSLARQISAAQRRVRVRIPGIVQQQARKVLGWQRSHPGEVVTLSAADQDRLEQLARGGSITIQELIAVNAWHARNRQTRLSATHKAQPWKDAGYVRGLANGGEVLARYAIRMVTTYARRQERVDLAEDAVMLAIEVPAGVGFVQAQAHVRSLLPDLELSTWHHITLLYVGRVPEKDMVEVQRLVQGAIAAFLENRRRGVALEVGRLGHFGPADRTPLPVVLTYYSHGLSRLHTALHRALTHLMTAPQHEQLRLHATAGYLQRPMTPTESTALLQTELSADLPAVKDWTPAEVVLRRGGVEVGRYPLLSARLDETIG